LRYVETSRSGKQVRIRVTSEIGSYLSVLIYINKSHIHSRGEREPCEEGEDREEGESEQVHVSSNVPMIDRGCVLFV